MDSAWAVVVGAAIAAIATIAGAPISATIAERRKRETAQRERLAEAISEAVQALLDWTRWASVEPSAARGVASERVLVAASQIGLLVKPGEDAVVQLVLGAYRIAVVAPQHSTELATFVADKLPSWYRGDTRLSEIAAQSDHWYMLLSERV